MIRNLQCIVIGIEEGSERFHRIQLFSAENGCEFCLKRKTTKRAGTQHLDLFQTVEVVLESKDGKAVSFLKETHMLIERTQIGKNYRAFERSSRFCKAIQLNAKHMQEPESIYSLLEQSLDAWNQKPCPDTIYFKAIYRLASEEGFPVRQLWLNKMNKVDRKQAESILRTPLSPEAATEELSKYLAENLINWLTHQQDFLF